MQVTVYICEACLTEWRKPENKAVGNWNIRLQVYNIIDEGSMSLSDLCEPCQKECRKFFKQLMGNRE